MFGELLKKTSHKVDVGVTSMSNEEAMKWKESLTDLPKTKCERCEEMIINAEFSSHKNSHSTEILPNLFLGGERNSKSHTELTKRTNIKYILNMSWEAENRFPDEFIYKKMNVQDYADNSIFDLFEDAIAFIEEAHKNEGNVLVHCVQGISRSATIVCAFLMKSKGMTRDEALEFVCTKREIANPNAGFREQLLKYEDVLKAKNE